MRMLGTESRSSTIIVVMFLTTEASLSPYLGCSSLVSFAYVIIALRQGFSM